VRRRGRAPEGRQQEQRAAAPRQLGEHGPRPEAGHQEREDVKHQQVGEQVALVRLLHLQQHRGEEAAQHREHGRAESASQDGHEGAQQGDHEHRDEGGAGADQVIEGVGGEEGQVEAAEAAPGQPLAQVGHVPPAVEQKAGQQHQAGADDSDPHSCRRPQVRVVEGPLEKERGRDQDHDDADPGRPASADALLEIKRGARGRNGHPERRGAGLGGRRRHVDGSGCDRGLGYGRRLGHRRGKRGAPGRRTRGAALEGLHAVQDRAEPGLERGDAPVRALRRPPRACGEQRDDGNDEGGHGQEQAEGEGHLGHDEGLSLRGAYTEGAARRSSFLDPQPETVPVASTDERY
jgi:hypothetical protein